VFSYGNDHYYSQLSNALRTIERITTPPTHSNTLKSHRTQTHGNTGIVSHVQSVKDGILNYIPDFQPAKTTLDIDYDKKDSIRQYQEQHPVAHQTILQFEIQTRNMPPLMESDDVLVNVEVNAMTGVWFPGSIARVNKDGTYEVFLDEEEDDDDDDDKEFMTVSRALLRTFDEPYSTTSEEDAMERDEGLPSHGPPRQNINVGQRVLIRVNAPWWNQGSVLEQIPADHNNDEHGYKVQVYDGEGTVVIVGETDVITQAEPLPPASPTEDADDSESTDESSTQQISKMFQESLQQTLRGMEKNANDINVYDLEGVGDGCIITCFWSGGSIVATWDGGTHIDVNFFASLDDPDQNQINSNNNGGLFQEELFEHLLLRAFPLSLNLMLRDEHPRGFGRVVNFREELQSMPHWASFGDVVDSSQGGYDNDPEEDDEGGDNDDDMDFDDDDDDDNDNDDDDDDDDDQ